MIAKYENIKWETTNKVTAIAAFFCKASIVCNHIDHKNQLHILG